MPAFASGHAWAAGRYWRSRKVVASRELLRSFLNELRARDLKAILSQGDMWNFTDPWAYADVIRDVLDPSVIAIVDAGNEAWQTGQRDPRELARWLARLNTNILTVTTSPPDATREMVERYRQGARVSEVHSDAGDPSGNVRRIWDAAYEANANVQGEPRGYAERQRLQPGGRAHASADGRGGGVQRTALRLHVVAGRHLGRPVPWSVRWRRSL